MPRRNCRLSTDETYHIYNRSSGKIPILDNKRNLKLFIDLIDYYRFPNTLRYSFFGNQSLEYQVKYLDAQTQQKPYVKIYAFALMPTHFHLLAKQLKDNGIKQFIGNIQNSFARFYNLKTDRNGSLFQGPFKANHIETEEEFMHVSRYIHLNPVSSFKIEIDELINYPWTSHAWYNDIKLNQFVDSSMILNHFKTLTDYNNFIYDRADYQRSLEEIKHLCFEKL